MFAAMLLLSVTAGAQTILGNWTLNKDYANILNAAVEEDNMKMEMGMSFTQSEVKIIVDCLTSDEDMSMKIQIVLPGTYIKRGDKVTCDFNMDKFDFDIIDIQTADEEMKEMISQPAMKKMVIAMIKEEAKKQMGSQMDSVGVMAAQFKEFTVKKVTKTKLDIECSGSPLEFDKKK